MNDRELQEEVEKFRLSDSGFRMETLLCFGKRGISLPSP